eukprot:1403526-Rhodomonas_salina.2
MPRESIQLLAPCLRSSRLPLFRSTPGSECAIDDGFQRRSQMPTEHFGLKDPALKYRNRHVDLLVSPNVSWIRSQSVASVVFVGL